MRDRPVDAVSYGLSWTPRFSERAAPRRPIRGGRMSTASRYGSGQRVTLVPEAGARAYGMLFALTRAELDRLYAAPGLERYRPEAVVARSLDGLPTAALWYNLVEAPRLHERNPEYAAHLQGALRKLAFPPEYVASVS